MERKRRESGRAVSIPRGTEVLVRKAAVDPEFKALLLGRRAAAADEIGLELDPAEKMMLDAVPRVQLETIIANTSVSGKSRKAFLGKAAALMLAALGVGASSCCEFGTTTGIRIDKPPPDQPRDKQEESGDKATEPEGEADAGRPDDPPFYNDADVEIEDVEATAQPQEEAPTASMEARDLPASRTAGFLGSAGSRPDRPQTPEANDAGGPEDIEP